MTQVKDATVAALDEREERWVDELLEAARQRLRFGWTQGAFGRTLAGRGQPKPDMDSVAFCLIGALTSAASALGADVYTLRRAERSVWESLDTEVREGLDPDAGPDMRHAHYVLQAWNDEPGRTKDEVIGLFERTLERRQVAPLRRRPAGVARIIATRGNRDRSTRPADEGGTQATRSRRHPTSVESSPSPA